MVDTHDGQRLAQLMRRARVADAQLASVTGVSVQAVGKWKRGGTIARAHIVQICRTLNASADELLGITPITDTPSGRPYDRDKMADALGAAQELFALPGAHVSDDAHVIVPLAIYDALVEGFDLDAAKRIVRDVLHAIG